MQGGGGWNPQGPGGPQQGGMPGPGYASSGYGAPQGTSPASMPGAGPVLSPFRSGPGITPPAPQGSFVGGLFDFSFTNFVTTRVMKVLYGLFLLGVVFGFLGGVMASLYTMFGGYRPEPVEGFIMLMMTGFTTIVGLLGGRVVFELVVVAFRISDALAEINRKTRE